MATDITKTLLWELLLTLASHVTPNPCGTPSARRGMGECLPPVGDAVKVPPNRSAPQC